MTITINGESRDLPSGTTLAALLELLGTPREGTAVARNDGVVPRADHASTALDDGDRLEIIVAVAGG